MVLGSNAPARTWTSVTGAARSGRRQGIRLWCAGAGIIPLLASAATAQVSPVPTVPTREEVERPLPRREAAPQSTLAVEGELERAPCTLDRPEYRDLRFTLSNVEFDNLRGITAEALRPAFAPFVGREQSVTVICEIRDRAAAILADAGYIVAVEVPEQRIAGGTVRFNVLMARLVGLRVRGDAGRAERLIETYLGGLTEREVFNRREAERALLLAGDLPGYGVRLALRSAGGAPGEVIGEVTVVRTPATVDFTVQNFGSRELGPVGGLLRAQLYGLTGLGDRTSLAVFSTADLREQQTVQIAHDFRIGGQGLTFGGQLTYAWARPDLGNAAIEFDSRTLFATLETSYPLVRRQAQTLRLGAGIDFVDQEVRFNGLDFTEDRLRVGFLRLTHDATGLTQGDRRYSPTEPRWRTSASIEARKGVDLFGASEGCGPALVGCLAPGAILPTRLEGVPTAALVRGYAAAEFRPDPRFTIAATVRAQYSGRPLFSFEEFSAGNYTIGRGYDPGTILGDSGLGLQAELRYGRLTPLTATAVTVQPFIFFDQAWVDNEDIALALPDDEISSLGGGLRAAWGRRGVLEVMLAVPLDRTTLRPDRDPRLLVAFTTRLWPWRLR
jgi:hemolysin activation/secretion protein